MWSNPKTGKIYKSRSWFILNLPFPIQTFLEELPVINIFKYIFLPCFLLFGTLDSYAVDGYEEYRFGMTLEETKKIFTCAWEKQDINFPGFMILSNKRAALYKCSTYPYKQREIEFYLEFIDDILQRIILDISAAEKENLQTLKMLKKLYGFSNGSIQEKGRRQIYTFDDASVEVELYRAPLNLMYLRFYSKNYRQLIRQPYLKGLKT